MKQPKPFPDPAEVQPMMDEVDIGSGEKTPGERETEEYVMSISPDSESSRGAQADRQGERGTEGAEHVSGESEQLDSSTAHQPLEQPGRMEPAARHG